MEQPDDLYKIKTFVKKTLMAEEEICLHELNHVVDILEKSSLYYILSHTNERNKTGWTYIWRK